MNTEDILISLSKLEESLKELDSAKELVEKTVASYNNAGIKIEAYTATLDSVSQNVTALIEIIKGNNAVFTNEANQQLQDVVNSFSKSVNGVRSIMDEILDKFKKETTSAEQVLSKSVEAIQNRLNSHCERLILEFNVSMDKARNSFIAQTTDIIKAFDVAGNKVLQDSETIKTMVKEDLSEGQKVVSDIKKELLRVNEEQAHFILQKIDLLEKHNQVLQRWIYVIIVLILVSLCIRLI